MSTKAANKPKKQPQKPPSKPMPPSPMNPYRKKACVEAVAGLFGS